MKKIEAIIRKTKFEEVKEALLEADIEWFSYYDVRGDRRWTHLRHPRRRFHPYPYRRTGRYRTLQCRTGKITRKTRQDNKRNKFK